MDRLLFNRNPIVLGNRIEQPSEELVRNTLGLFNASIEDAVKYGGELTRAALGAMNLRNVIRTQQQVYAPIDFGW